MSSMVGSNGIRHQRVWTLSQRDPQETNGGAVQSWVSSKDSEEQSRKKVKGRQKDASTSIKPGISDGALDPRHCGRELDHGHPSMRACSCQQDITMPQVQEPGVCLVRPVAAGTSGTDTRAPRSSGSHHIGRKDLARHLKLLEQAG